MARILVSGYYGLGNFGDEALLDGLLQLLRPAHHVTVLSGNPAETRQLHGVPAVHRYRGLPGALLRSDVLLSGGGGLLQDSTSSRSLSYYLGVIRLARLLGRKTLVYGQSIGPLSSSGRARVRAALRGTALAVRDEQSVGLLAELGLDAALVADPALALQPDHAKPAKATDLLLVPRAGYPDLTAALVAAGQAAAEDGPVRIGLLALQESEDAVEIRQLSAALPDAELLHAADHRAALNIISAASFVLSARLHGLILAVAAGRPCAGLVYDPKVRGFLELAGAPVFDRPVDDAALLRLVRKRPAGSRETGSRLVAAAAAGPKWLAQQLASE